MHQARIQAAHSISRQIISLYLQIGEGIAERQARLGWGKSLVEQLSKDLSKDFTGEEGFSARNLWRMRQLYLEYKDFPNLTPLVSEIPWTHNVIILNKVKDPDERAYYLRAVAEQGWSKTILTMQIDTQAYQRHLLEPKQHNFERTLAPALAEQANKALKSIYSLEFLGIQKNVLEREIERRMVNRIRDVMLELGQGFAFIGNQHKLTVGDQDFYIDLLFYHRDLKCLVAMELKNVPFEPEYALNLCGFSGSLS